MFAVQTTNQISNDVLVIAMGAGCFAAGAVAAASPIGPLGGALFGAVRQLSLTCLEGLSANCLNTQNPRANTASKILSFAIDFFGSLAVAWAVLAVTGFVLTAGEVCLLGAASAIFLIPIAAVATLAHNIFRMIDQSHT